jgi:hypothetical protein
MLADLESILKQWLPKPPRSRVDPPMFGEETVRDVYIPRSKDDKCDDDDSTEMLIPHLLSRRKTEDFLINGGSLLYDLVAEGLEPLEIPPPRQSRQSRERLHLESRAREKAEEKRKKALMELKSFVSKVEQGRVIKEGPSNSVLAHALSATDDDVYAAIQQVMSTGTSHGADCKSPTSSVSRTFRSQQQYAELLEILERIENDDSSHSLENSKFLPSERTSTSSSTDGERTDTETERTGSGDETTDPDGVRIDTDGLLTARSIQRTRRSPSPRARDSRFHKMREGKSGRRIPRPRPEDFPQEIMAYATAPIRIVDPPVRIGNTAARPPSSSNSLLREPQLSCPAVPLPKPKPVAMQPAPVAVTQPGRTKSSLWTCHWKNVQENLGRLRLHRDLCGNCRTCHRQSAQTRMIRFGPKPVNW